LEVQMPAESNKSRRIGPIGTASRVLVGVGLLYLAGGAAGLSWGVEWYDPVVGLIVLPAIMVAAGLAAARYAPGPVRLTGPLAICLNCLVILALVLNPYTGAGALLFYGTTLLISAWRGQPGCEATVISNMILGREDQIGCPTFSPLDAAEAKHRARPMTGAAQVSR
jgi:hypothetical protein